MMTHKKKYWGEIEGYSNTWALCGSFIWIKKNGYVRWDKVKCKKCLKKGGNL